jgi:hypothetical protein
MRGQGQSLIDRSRAQSIRPDRDTQIDDPPHRAALPSLSPLKVACALCRD